MHKMFGSMQDDRGIERPHAARPGIAGGLAASLHRSSGVQQGGSLGSKSPTPAMRGSKSLQASLQCAFSACQSPRQSLRGEAGMQLPANSFGGLLQVLKRLLELHEVRLTVQLLEDLVGQPLANAVLSIPMAEIAVVFHRFSKKQRKDRSLSVGEGINEIDKYAGAIDVIAEKRNSLRPSESNWLAAPEAGSRLPSRSTTPTAGTPRIGSQDVPEIILDNPVATGAWATGSGSLQNERSHSHEQAVDIVDLPKASSAGSKAEGHSERKNSIAAWTPVMSTASSVQEVPIKPAGFAHFNGKQARDLTSKREGSMRSDDTEMLEARGSINSISSWEECGSLPARNGHKFTVILPDAVATDHQEDDLAVTSAPVEDFIRPVESGGHVTFQHRASLVSREERTTIGRRSSNISRLSGQVGVDARQSITERIHRAHMAAQLLRAKTRHTTDRNAATIEAFQDAYSGGHMKVHLSTNFHNFGMDVIDETWLSMPSNRLIIHPNGPGRMTWDILALFTVMTEAVLVPLGVFFEMNTPDWVAWLITIFFAIDILLNFVTGFFHDGLLVMKQCAIIFNYCRSWFILDAVSTFPWGVVAGSSSGSVLRFAKIGKMMRVLRLLRIAKLNVLFGRVEELFSTSSLIVALSLGKIVVFLAILCHWVACLWGWFGEPHRHSEGSLVPLNRTVCEPDGPCEPSIEGSPWRRRYSVEQEPLVEQYIIALRFATGLFTGGDVGIQPGHYSERIFVVLTMFWSFILCSAVISQIVVTFHKIYQEQQEQHELMRNFKEFMNACKAPATIRAKVKRYLEFQFKVRKDLQVRRFEMMERLSPWLRAELKVHLNKGVLEQHPFFKSTPASVLAHACVVADCIICAPGDIVIQRGQLTRTIYFLVRGKLHIQINATWASEDSFLEESADDPGFLMLPPGFIGARALFMEEVHPYTVSAVAHTEMLTLTRDHMNDLANEFPSFSTQLMLFINPEAIENAMPVVDSSSREVNAGVKNFDSKQNMSSRA